MKTYILKKDLDHFRNGYTFTTQGCCPSIKLPIFGGLIEMIPSNYPDWFEEKKPERWKPGSNELYHIIDDEGEPQFSQRFGDQTDEQRHQWGNCFRTKEQAEEAAKRVKETLLKYHEEIGE